MSNSPVVELVLIDIESDVQQDTSGFRLEDILSNRLNECYSADKLAKDLESDGCLGNHKKNDNISEQVKENVMRYLHRKDQYTALVSCLLKSQALHKACNCSSSRHVVVELPRTVYGKPFIPGQDAPFSISHQFPYVANARLLNSSSSIGMDLVVFNPHNPRLYKTEIEFINIFQGHFTDNEWLQINGDLKELYVRWAVKEAYTKALGVGFGEDFNSFETRFPVDALWPISKATHLCGTVHKEGRPNQVWNFSFFPLFGESNNPKGCVCVCVGPAGKETQDLKIEWDSFGGLLSWHGLAEDFS